MSKMPDNLKWHSNGIINLDYNELYICMHNTQCSKNGKIIHNVTVKTKQKLMRIEKNVQKIYVFRLYK